jgi:acyl transferase domain-containing protein/acyl carrier protein
VRLLELLGDLWRSGLDVDWTAVHAQERRRRVPLPTYPFERQRFWIEPEVDEADVRDPARWLYRPVWKTAMPLRAPSTGPKGCCLVFTDTFGLGSQVAQRLRAAGAQAITVAAGSAFEGEPGAGYVLDPREARHYRLLFEDLERRGKRPDRILHLWSMESLETTPAGRARFERASLLGFYSLVRLQAARPAGPLALTVVSAGLHDVVGGDLLVPEKAPISPLCRVLGQEDHELRCSLVDVETGAPGFSAVADALLRELALEAPEPVLAIRNGRRWVQDYELLPATTPLTPATHLREGGVYLITGGLGDVGFVMGAFLAKTLRAKLVLTGRRGLPPREEWSRRLEAQDASDETALRIRKVQTLEGLGGEVLVLQADAASGPEMKEAVRAARERFGSLHGVIHAAGELSPDTFRAVRDLEPAAAERQFAPKVHGLFALEEAVAAEKLDFCLLTSSLSSVLGGIGYGAYAGANAFMDAFAARASRQGAPWLSVAFDQWDVGGRSASGAARKAIRDGSALKPVEGLAVFDRSLRLAGLDRVVVSTSPLADRLERWVRQPTAPAAAPEGARPRPAMQTAYVAPANDAERTLAGIWQELLGVERVGRNDNFFELGGHSLFAARVLSRVRSAFGVSLPLEAVFEDPTLSGLAARAEAARWARADAEAPAGDRVEIEI